MYGKQIVGHPNVMLAHMGKCIGMVPFLVLMTCIIALTKPAAAQHREVGAHEHGRGTLNIALEGTRLTLELEVPGADIVGFEHAAKTPRQKAAIDQAKKQLTAPLALFKLPAPAGCIVQEASAKIEGGEHKHGHGHAKSGKDEKGKEHSEFHATYTLECKSPASITAIEFDYFRLFPGAQKLGVNLITPKGQTKFEVTRAKPQISLAGMM